MSAWDTLVGPTSLVWLLATARLFAIMRVQPAWRLAVGPWWTAVCLGLAAMLSVAASPVAPTVPESPGLVHAAVLVVVELGVGSLVGLLASLPAYALLGARLGWNSPKQDWQAWLDLRNLTNKRYAATVTPGYDDAGQDAARSTPGEGFGVYTGVSYSFR